MEATSKYTKVGCRFEELQESMEEGEMRGGTEASEGQREQLVDVLPPCQRCTRPLGPGEAGADSQLSHLPNAAL